MTKDLHLAITLDLAELLSVSAVARNNYVPVSTVQSVLKHLSLPKRCFPDAVICIDLFHVVNRLNSAVDEVRRRLQHLFLDRDGRERYECLKHSAYLLKTSKANQKQLWGASFQKRSDRLDAALSVSNDLKEVYDRKGGCRPCVNHPARNSSPIQLSIKSPMP